MWLELGTLLMLLDYAGSFHPDRDKRRNRHCDVLLPAVLRGLPLVVEVRQHTWSSFKG